MSAPTPSPSAGAVPRAPDAAGAPLPLIKKIIYGTGGGIANFTLNSPNYLANPILNLTLGLNPVLIGTVLAIARLWDAVMDPLFGHWSDNARTRWGRRRPFLVAGALLMGVGFAAMWWLPRGASHGFYFGWFLVTTLVFYAGNSCYLVPWAALGVELATDYDERTRLNAFVGAWHKIVGMSAAWLYPLAQLAIFGDVLNGARVVGVVCGALLFFGGLVPALLLKENPAAVAASPRLAPPRESFFAAMQVVCRNRVFLRLAAVSVVAMTALMTVSSLNLYINIYYLFGGDTKRAAQVAALFGMWFNVLAIVSIPAVTWLAGRIGKDRAILFCLGLVLVSALLKFVLYTPANPWLQFLIPLLHAPGWSAFYVLMGAMTADLVDYDEYLSGRRREALIVAANQWLTKLGMSTSYISAGLVLGVTGFAVERGAAQDPATILWMRILFSAIPATGLALAMLLLARYPLTRARIAEVQTALQARRASRSNP